MTKIMLDFDCLLCYITAIKEQKRQTMKAKRFAKFYQFSTGYVAGTIPPRFDLSHKSPIPACGSDSVYFFDGRLSMTTCIAQAKTACKQRNYIGFTIENEPMINHKIIRQLELIKA